MRLDPARWRGDRALVVPLAIVGLLAVGSLTGAFQGAVGGALLATAVGAFGAVIWRSDAIPWVDIASWTVPLAVLLLIAWVFLADVPYLIAGLALAGWLASFIFWLPPVRWWYRWVLRKDLPFGNRSRRAPQLHELDLAIGQAFRQYDRDADASEDFGGLKAANRKRPGLTEDRLGDLEGSFGIRFPADYAQFLRWSDGWEGWIGDASYVRLHGADELRIANDVDFRSAFPGLLAIGGDGGLETYAIDFRQPGPNPGIVAVDRNSADDRDISPVASGFLEALDAFGQARPSSDISER